MLTRMWINQPSENQEFHHLHGRRVLVENSKIPFPTVYFADSGELVSQIIDAKALSKGWKEQA